jgi:hypothetical protein
MELEGLTSLYVGEFFGLARFVIVLVGDKLESVRMELGWSDKT